MADTRNAIPRQEPVPAAARFRLNMRNLMAGVVIVGLTAVVAPGFVLVVMVGMLPSAVARLTDGSKHKYKSICVGMANWAGVFPYVIKLFSSVSSIAGAKLILGSSLPYLAMWGAAAFGYLLFMAIPPVVGSFLTVMAQRKIASLRSTQRRLVDEWGEDVANLTKR